MGLRRPHVVSEGYLRNFAEGKFIKVITKADRIDRPPIGTKDTFVRKHFLRVIIDGVSTDDAEDEFGRIETLALPIIRTVRPNVTLTEQQELSVRAVIAMLWARSFAGEVVRERVHSEVVEKSRKSYLNNSEFTRRFVAQFGRRPLAADVVELVEFAADRMRAERAQAVAAILRHHNSAIDRFIKMHIATYAAPPGKEFVTSDNPVILARDLTLFAVGAHNRIALDDANCIFLALTRTVGVCLTSEPEEDGELEPIDMYRLNNAAWRNAVERIACHPSLDWAEACNVVVGASGPTLLRRTVITG